MPTSQAILGSAGFLSRLSIVAFLLSSNMVQLLGVLLVLAWSLLLSHGPAYANPRPNIPAEFQALTWTYDSDENSTGPNHWGELDAEFTLCDRGQQQSPINLHQASPTDIPNLDFHYRPSPVQVQNNGRTLQVNYEPGSYVMLEGERFDLLQFHFHHPSEHSLEEQESPMELHLVHRDRQGKLAVIGILIDRGAENQALVGVWENLVPAYTSATETSAQVDASQLLPDQGTSYRYSGSLTTPPCSESVAWIVMEQPIYLSSQQITAFTQLLPPNNRPRQSIHGRSLQLDISP